MSYVLLKLRHTALLFEMSQRIVSLATQSLDFEQVNHAGKEIGIRLLPCQKQQKLLEMGSTLHMVSFQKTFPTR